MDSAKKLLLVDPSCTAQLYRLTTTDKKLTFLDLEIDDTLNIDLPDDLKAKRYLTLLKDYRKYDTLPLKPSTEDDDILKDVPELKRPVAR